jgi:diaminopropionate ammonia-lyase
MEIPGWIIEGYATLFEEAAGQLAAAGRRPPSAVLLQAGVGALPCSGALFYRRHGPRPVLIAVEPLAADCLRESIASAEGGIHEALGRQDSIMAGLNCGTPSLLAWPVLKADLDGFLAVDDDYARDAMRRFAGGRGGDPAVVSGESGAAGLAGLLALCQEGGLAAARRQLGLDAQARVLLINTEGDTDPVSYQRIVGRTA